MIFGDLDYDLTGSAIVGRIYLEFPENISSELLLCTESNSPSIWLENEDWHPYEGEDYSEEAYYLINGTYYPDTSDCVDDFLDNCDEVQTYNKVDVYEKGKLIKTYYKEIPNEMD